MAELGKRTRLESDNLNQICRFKSCSVRHTPLAEWLRRLTQNQLHRGSSVRIRQGVPCPHNSTWESDGLKNHRLTVQIRLWTLNRGMV